MRIQIYLISQINFDYKENAGRKVFLRNTKQQYHVTQYGEHSCSANNKKNGDYY